MNAEPTKKWANLFNSNRMSAKRMSLSYVNPVMKNGEKVIELKKEEIDKAIEEWKHALILYVVGDSPTIAAVERYIALQVNTVSKPKVYCHNDGYFLVQFVNMVDRNEVLYLGPHLLNNRPIIVKVWNPKFDFNKEVLQTVPIWVKYPNLPLNCWSMDSLSRIRSGLGEPLHADKCTMKVDRIAYAQVLIEMDVARELPKKLKVEDPNGRMFEQVVQYEWVPEYCVECMQGSTSQESGIIVHSHKEIKNEATIFYKALLGQTTSNLPSVDINIMKKRGTLNREQQLQLAGPVTREKVKLALQGISDLKAPGKDGLNAMFFKKAS
ncbi:uncharacterized protein LOC125863797 [Solanum stenotomum]|uniref:uncharacterized protein LOC125863797 n=1 Tax=Solanum stenotomum TaxID=172797 RepID=UPI0020D08567|nr:uncharacterized protein LOC125863797 [Solanum stenotomum]